MAKSYLSKADFLAGITQKPVEFEVPGLGWVLLRGLTTLELAELQTQYESQPIELMVRGVQLGMVEPALSVEDLAALNQSNPGKVSLISQRVYELSGQGNAEVADPLAGGGS
jgi:hypothetical protein